MQSTTKHQKSRKQVRVEEMKDRISSLPNEILCHILSFLPTKSAVGTCILSTRWKYLWNSLPDLDFDDSLLFHGKRLSPWLSPDIRREKDISGREETLSMSFTSFVDRVLILRNVSYIRRFRLRLWYLDKNYECSMNTWICAALWRNVQELDLTFFHIDSKVLPRGLFSCGTLVSLKLYGLFALDVPASVCLPKLKTLFLHRIIFRDNDSTQMLFSSCPVLEALHISSCRCEKGSVFNISSLALKRLSIYHDRDRDGDEYKFIIDVPRLEYINLSDFVGKVSSVSSIGSLIEADLCVEDNNRDFKLIRVISNVKVLRICGQTTGAILSSDQGLPVFPNLTHLELGVDYSEHHGWELLPDLLQNSPNLESLLICPAQGIKEFEWRKVKRVPHCLLHHLKTVEIRHFEGRKQDLKVVEYFLKTAKVLQKLIIDNSLNNHLGFLSEEEELKISTKLLWMFPMRSTTCQVVYCPFNFCFEVLNRCFEVLDRVFEDQYRIVDAVREIKNMSSCLLP